MKGLSKSASAPGIAPAVALGLAPGFSSSSPLLEGTLYVARPANSDGPASWEPYRFAHHHDGSISFQSIKGKGKMPSGGDAGLSGGQLPGVQVRGSRDEFFLDADWRQPFVAAPWKPVSRAGATESQLQLPDVASRNTKEPFGELFPFTLSYAPARPKPGDADSASSRRRTVVLAAPNARGRARWLATLARKAHSPELRSGPGAVANAPGGAVTASSGRRIAALGEEHRGLPVTAGLGSSIPRLPAGHPSLFDSHSSLRIVRDLYDGYAADPLSQNSKGQQRSSTDSDSSGAGPPSTSKTRKSKFLERYLDRQAEIEKILDHKWSGGTGPAQTSSDAALSEEVSRHAPPGEARDVTAVSSQLLGGKPSDVGTLFPERLQLADKTANVTLKGNILSNTQWSGGAIFNPPDEKSFRLTICPVDPLEEYPIFIGLAPPDADLTMVSFFSSGGGVFLCVGGRASDDLISALGAPGGPAFFCLGERRFASLPAPKPGQSISVHYTQGEDSGQVRFFISSKDGEEVKSDTPPLVKGLPLGSWRPCVLLCMPGTRVHIVRLI